MIRFHGHDWTELKQLKQIASTWPRVPAGFLKSADFLSEQDARDFYVIDKYLASVKGKEEKLVCRYLRAFLQKLAEEDKKWSDDSHIIYLAVIKTRDSTLIDYVRTNMRNLWT